MTTETATCHTGLSGPSCLFGNVKANIYFFVPPPDGAAPFNHAGFSPEGLLLEHNYSKVAEQVTIQDLRGREAHYKLSTYGFEPLTSDVVSSTASTEMIDFGSDESIRRDYYPEIERLLLKNLDGNPERVFIFDHTVRRSESNGYRKAVLQAHVDQTPYSAAARVKLYIEDDAEKLLKDRFRLVNV